MRMQCLAIHGYLILLRVGSIRQYGLDFAISVRDKRLRLQRKVVYVFATHALPVAQH